MSWRISIVELPDGEILIDGQPTDFAPPWKTEGAIRQQASDIAELRADLTAAVAERDSLARQNGNLSIRLASAIARQAAIEAAPVVARVFESNRDFATGPSRCLAYTNSELPVPGTELIAKPAKDAP